MSVSRTPKLLVAVAAILVGTAATAWADPPARVGRLSDVEGTVSFHTADQTDWSPATLNYPVTTGTSFWTEPNSKAEVQIGASEVRLDQGTWADVTQLDDDATQIRVNQGAVNVHVHVLPAGGISVLTPKGQVDLIAPGSYNINAGAPVDDNTPADQTLVTVLEGHARFDGPSSSVDVQDGEAATISGDPINVALAEGDSTPFDDWALSREHREAAPQTAQYVPPEMTGAQDLDAYGQWSNTPDYGRVWYPTQVAADWAPYQAGHWAYVAPWGWTWIDDAPWGFAPFHYGRWAHINGRWGWAPSSPGVVVAQRPVYAPALVAFVGGNGFGITLSIGGPTAAVGWVPLAPYEAYHPWYRASRDYVRNVNVVNVRKTEINNITIVNNTTNVTVQRFANRTATTVVPAQAFTHAAPVQRARVAVPAAQIERLQVTNRRGMDAYQATADARAAAARPTAAAAQQKPNVQAQVAAKPVAYHPEPAAARAEPAKPAPGPRAGGPGNRPAPALRQNAAVTSPPQRPQPNAAPAAPAQPAVAAPAPAAPAQPNAQDNKVQPVVAAPAPRPGAQPNAAEARPQPAAAAPAPHPPGQPDAERNRPQPAAAAPAPHPPGQPNAQPNRPLPAAVAPAPAAPVQPNAEDKKVQPAVATPAPHPPGQPDAERNRPLPAAVAPAPHPPSQPNAEPNRPLPAAAAPAPRPPAQPNAQEERKPAAVAPAPRPPEAAQPVRPAVQPAAPARPPVQTQAQRPQAPPAPVRGGPVQARPQMQVQHPAQPTRIQPTPEGWKRQAAPAAAQQPHAAPAPAPAKPAPAPANEKDKDKDKDQKN